MTCVGAGGGGGAAVGCCGPAGGCWAGVCARGPPPPRAMRASADRALAFAPRSHARAPAWRAHARRARPRAAHGCGACDGPTTIPVVAAGLGTRRFQEPTAPIPARRPAALGRPGRSPASATPRRGLRRVWVRAQVGRWGLRLPASARRPRPFPHDSADALPRALAFAPPPRRDAAPSSARSPLAAAASAARGLAFAAHPRSTPQGSSPYRRTRAVAEQPEVIPESVFRLAR